MNEFTWHHPTPFAPIRKKPCIYRCTDCGLVGQLEMPETFPQGGAFSCVRCLFRVEVFDLDIGSPGLAIRWLARPGSFKRRQYFTLLRVWFAGRINTWQALRGFLRPATDVWFDDQITGGALCVCPAILAGMDAVDG